jgi:hypothetical protein
MEIPAHRARVLAREPGAASLNTAVVEECQIALGNRASIVLTGLRPSFSGSPSTRRARAHTSTH